MRYKTPAALEMTLRPADRIELPDVPSCNYRILLSGNCEGMRWSHIAQEWTR